MPEEIKKTDTYQWLYNNVVYKNLIFAFLFIFMCYFLKVYSLHLFGDGIILIRRRLLKHVNRLSNVSGFGFFKHVSNQLERKNTLSINEKKREKANQPQRLVTKSLRVKYSDKNKETNTDVNSQYKMHYDETSDFFKDLGENIELLDQAFRMFDIDGSGIISRKEFRNVVRSLGHNPSEEQINLLMAKVDVDGNGMIDSKELLNFMTSHFGVWDPKGDLLPVFQMLAEPDPNASITSKSSDSSSSEDPTNGFVKGEAIRCLIYDHHSPDFEDEELEELLNRFSDDELYDFETFVKAIAGPESTENYYKDKVILDSSLSYSPGI